jgi:hypothetical protein
MELVVLITGLMLSVAPRFFSALSLPVRSGRALIVSARLTFIIVSGVIDPQDKPLTSSSVRFVEASKIPGYFQLFKLLYVLW